MGQEWPLRAPDRRPPARKWVGERLCRGCVRHDIAPALCSSDCPARVRTTACARCITLPRTWALELRASAVRWEVPDCLSIMV